MNKTRWEVRVNGNPKMPLCATLEEAEERYIEYIRDNPKIDCAVYREDADEEEEPVIAYSG